jgi:hypothetical protein
MMRKTRRSNWVAGVVFAIILLFAFPFCVRGCGTLRMKWRYFLKGERDVNMQIDPVELLRQDQISQLIPVLADEEEENLGE